MTQVNQIRVLQQPWRDIGNFRKALQQMEILEIVFVLSMRANSRFHSYLVFKENYYYSLIFLPLKEINMHNNSKFQSIFRYFRSLLPFLPEDLGKSG
jgi:hypothetical protein